MKSICYLFVLIAILSCCNNGQSSFVVNRKDTIPISPNDQTNDTTLQLVKEHLVTDDTDINEQDDVLADYISQYRQDYSFDSIFVSRNDSFKIIIHHYCLMDSAIVVPGRYVKTYDLDSFITHNFESSLVIVKNQDTIVKTKIQKVQFNSLLESPVKEYGVLQPRPYVYLLKDTVEINYSLSIPLTDLGKGVTAKVAFDGEMSFRNRP